MDIALVAPDRKKPQMLEWARHHRDLLLPHTIYSTAATGDLLEAEVGLKVRKTLSGPLGGDQQIGARIAQGEIDLLVFLWDPLESQPHESDVKALLRLAAVWDVPMASNESTAHMLITSQLLGVKDYRLTVPDAHAWRPAA